MRSPKGGSGGAGWPVFAGVGSGSVGLDLLNTEPSMEPWERAGNADSWRAMQPSFGWHITGAGVLRARAPDVRCASRTSTRPSTVATARAAIDAGASSKWPPSTTAIEIAHGQWIRRLLGYSALPDLSRCCCGHGRPRAAAGGGGSGGAGSIRVARGRPRCVCRSARMWTA